VLTLFGRQIVKHYRDMERAAELAVAGHLRALDGALVRRRR
jgi:hypothetical protein